MIVVKRADSLQVGVVRGDEVDNPVNEVGLNCLAIDLYVKAAGKAGASGWWHLAISSVVRIQV